MIKEKTPIKFTLNGKEIAASPDSRHLILLKRKDFKFHLCFNSNYRADGNCRSCVVEIMGKTLAPSCCRRPENGMEVYTHSERAESARKMVLEMLGSDTKVTQATKKNHELRDWSEKLEIKNSRLPNKYR